MGVEWRGGGDFVFMVSSSKDESVNLNSLFSQTSLAASADEGRGIDVCFSI